MFDRKPVTLSANERKRNIPEKELPTLESKLGQVDLYEQEAKIKIGEQIPENFIFTTTDSAKINLFEISKNNHVIIFVYPGDKRGLEYPELYGCTPEACEFNAKLQDFVAQGAVVYGASIQPIERQKEFVTRAKLNLPIINDSKKTLANTLGVNVWRAQKGGEEFLDRTTIVIEKGGIVRSVMRDVKVEGHADEVLGQLKALKKPKI